LTALFGLIFGAPTLRLRGDYLAIVTLGFGEILRVIIQQTNPQAFTYEEFKSRPLFGANPTSPGWVYPPGVGGSLGFNDIPKVTNLFWAYLFVGIVVLFAYRLKTSSYGRAMISIREDEIAAQATGKNVVLVRIVITTVSSALGALAGSLYAHYITYINPTSFTLEESIFITSLVVLGGTERLAGPMLGAFILLAVPEALKFLAIPDSVAAPMRQILYGVLLILFMFLRPEGILGRARARPTA
jgi:branched-chain amino acid transport system permease protein